ncbi:MAG: aspartate/glutamate racemase family protein [Marinibacterium sp.]
MIVLINPNSTVSMTESMLRTARDMAPDLAIDGWTSHGGPAAIQGPEDGAAAVPPLLELVRKAADQGAEAILIGCFDDTGLAEAKAGAACPVIGIGQAAYHMAALFGRFSVVTTLDVSVPVLEDNIAEYRLQENLGRVRASGVEVLALEQETDRIVDEILRAEAEDSVSAVVLGCGGMVDIAEAASGRTRLPLIDGVRAAVQVARCVVSSPA